jgi:hypothetical protein
LSGNLGVGAPAYDEPGDSSSRSVSDPMPIARDDKSEPVIGEALFMAFLTAEAWSGGSALCGLRSTWLLLADRGG